MYEACCELFADYPLAVEVEDVNHGRGDVQSMVLMLDEGDGPRFFTLEHDRGEGRSSCSLRPRDAGAIVSIEPDGTAAVPDVIVKVVAHGLPIPRHNSMFGWNDRGIITALTIFYTKRVQQPGFTWLPLAGLPEAQWPPCMGESLFGRWFWDRCKDGWIVPLADLIAGTLETVYWVDTPILGWGCCAVARDVENRELPVLRRGRYVYCQTLRAGTPVPPLTALLAQSNKTDLGPKFRPSM